MKRYLRYQIIIVAALLFWGSLATDITLASSKETLIIAGTGSSVGTMRLMAKGFQKKYPNATVEVLPSIGSTGGIKAVREGKIDIGLSSRVLLESDANVAA
jgi:phosphate transport system substrate-binding protein